MPAQRAVIYLVLDRRRYGTDPAQYLHDVLCRLPEMKITEIAQITLWLGPKPEKSVRLASGHASIPPPLNGVKKAVRLTDTQRGIPAN